MRCMLGFFRNNFGFGGNNGLTDFKDILGFNVQAEGTRNALLVISCLALALCFLICRAIVTSKFGKVLVAIRDAEARTRFLGYRVEAYKLFVFTLSACMAGVAGALYVPQVGIINPSEFAPGNSIEAVIWVAVGGRGTLTGAVLGAFVVNYAKTFFTSGLLAPYWLFVLGGLFIARDAAAAARHHRHLSSIGGHERRAEKTMRSAAGRGAARGGVGGMEPQTTSALLYLDGISVSFDGFKALNELSFIIEPGEMRAIIGPNGAGKTTMMDVITGKTRPDSGDVFFEQGALRSDQARRDRDRRARHRPQVPEADRVRHAYGRGQSAAGAEERPQRARHVDLGRRLDAAGPHRRDSRHHPAQAVRSRVAGSLSHGQKQWLEIGMLLAQEPKLLLVDEPVAGMTDAETLQTAELLKEINRDKTVVVVEHDMAFVRELGVKVTCLHEGSVLAEGTHRPGVDERARGRSVSGTVTHARSQRHRSALRRGAGAARHFAQGRARQGHLRARPQRRRQDQPAARDRRPASGEQRHDPARTATTSPGSAHGARARGIAYRAARPRDFPAAHGRGKPRNRLCAAAARRAQRARRRVLAVSGAAAACSSGAAAICPAASSSNWRSAARW